MRFKMIAGVPEGLLPVRISLLLLLGDGEALCFTANHAARCRLNGADFLKPL